MNSMGNQRIHSVKVNNSTMKNAVLIDGEYSGTEALELVASMYLQKIRFHESKISQSDSEEDIKHREEKIKQLQINLRDLQTSINSKSKVHLHAEIAISPL
jgi:hypothetical protein